VAGHRAAGLFDAGGSHRREHHQQAAPQRLFVDDPEAEYASIDSIAPYALLALEAAFTNTPDAVAPFLNGAGFTEVLIGWLTEQFATPPEMTSCSGSDPANSSNRTAKDKTGPHRGGVARWDSFT
jgi:hypothetical protein